MIADDVERFAGAGDGHHRAGKIRAVAAVDPCGSDNEPPVGGVFLKGVRGLVPAPEVSDVCSETPFLSELLELVVIVIR